MTKPTDPKDDSVVEIDAMDEKEWESDQRTPEVHNDDLAKLVKHSVSVKTPDPERAPTIQRTGTARAVVATVSKTNTTGAVRTVPAAPPPSSGVPSAKA